MSDTPRTDAVWELFAADTTLEPDVEFSGLARQLERELNAANDYNREIRERNEWLNDKIDAASQRIKRLEELGNELRDCASRIGTVASGEGSVIRRTQDAIKAWDKEAKP